MFYYLPIVPGVYVLLLTDCTEIYVLLLTDCTWNLCFVTHRLHHEYMFCYDAIDE
jgi:hypothetical protein